MSLRSKVAAVGLAAGLLLAGLGAPAASHAEPTTDAAATAAGNWLAQQFVGGGQYLNGYDGTTPDPANTVDGVLALLAVDAAPETVSTASSWLTVEAATYVNDPSSAARMAIFADAAGLDATDLGGFNAVKAMQNELGELTSNPYGLALLVIGLERTTGEVPAEVLDALLATQDTDGAFAFPDYGVDIDSTALAAQALASQDDQRSKQAAKQATDWLVTQQCTEVSELCPVVGDYWGSYSPVNTAGLAIPALAQAGVNVDAQRAWLAAQQLPDGGFPPALGADYSDAYATAQAVVGLWGDGVMEVRAAAADDASTGSNRTLWWIAGGLVMLVVVRVVIVWTRRRPK